MVMIVVRARIRATRKGYDCDCGWGLELGQSGGLVLVLVVAPTKNDGVSAVLPIHRCLSVCLFV